MKKAEDSRILEAKGIVIKESPTSEVKAIGIIKGSISSYGDLYLNDQPFVPGGMSTNMFLIHPEDKLELRNKVKQITHYKNGDEEMSIEDRDLKVKAFAEFTENGSVENDTWLDIDKKFEYFKFRELWKPVHEEVMRVTKITVAETDNSLYHMDSGHDFIEYSAMSSKLLAYGGSQLVHQYRLKAHLTKMIEDAVDDRGLEKASSPYTSFDNTYYTSRNTPVDWRLCGRKISDNTNVSLNKDIVFGTVKDLLKIKTSIENAVDKILRTTDTSTTKVEANEILSLISEVKSGKEISATSLTHMENRIKKVGLK